MAVAADEAVRIAMRPNLLGQPRFAFRAGGLGGEAEVQRVLLVEHGQQPVL
jgi:hypothetical protein